MKLRSVKWSNSFCVTARKLLINITAKQQKKTKRWIRCCSASSDLNWDSLWVIQRREKAKSALLALSSAFLFTLNSAVTQHVTDSRAAVIRQEWFWYLKEIHGRICHYDIIVNLFLKFVSVFLRVDVSEKVNMSSLCDIITSFKKHAFIFCFNILVCMWTLTIVWENVKSRCGEEDFMCAVLFSHVDILTYVWKNVDISHRNIFIFMWKSD